MKWLCTIACPLIFLSFAVAQHTSIPQRYLTDILDARTIAVVSYSQAEPVNDPHANERARLDAEQALLRWGKYQVTGDPSIADLIFVVRKGRARSTTVNPGGPPGAILY